MSRRENGQEPPWAYITLGLGTGLLLTLLVGLAVRRALSHEPEDPRARQVQELLEEAERLLAQGRRSGS